jgi:malonyl-CoA/methylmalonyl-CoA synthetase
MQSAPAQHAAGTAALGYNRNDNLFAALRNGFPSDRHTCAVETDLGLRYSWQDLEQSSAMVANLLESLALPKGARVVAQVEKSVEAMVLYLASLRAGLVYVPLNAAYRSAEIEYFLQDAMPTVVVCQGTSFGWLSKMAFLSGATYVFTLNDDRTGSLLERAARFSPEHSVVPCGAEDIAAIVYTSGTTGHSKGAMLSHGNLLSNAQVLQTYWDWQPADVLLHALPIFHVHGLFVAIHGALLNGSKMLWLNKFDPKTVLQKLPNATVFMGVPTMYVRLLAEPSLSANAVRNMRLFISGSAPLLMETFNDWQRRTGHTVLERYGMSETVMLTSNPCKATDGARRGGTVGRPLPGVCLRVQSDQGDQGEDMLPGETGGVQVKGPSVFKGYWNMPDKTAEEFTADDYFNTGDVGHLDADGYLTLVGRSKDLIISGGYNVYPAEIEAAINAMAGVVESAVVGIPDVDFGEVGVAVVVAGPDGAIRGESILSQLKSQLANFKVPKQCHLVPELPRNAMGKVLKNILRSTYGGRSK